MRTAAPSPPAHHTTPGCSRRRLLGLACGSAAALLLDPLLGALAAAGGDSLVHIGEPVVRYPYSPHYGMVIRQAACTGCGRCVEACGRVNAVPAGGWRITVLSRANGGRQEFLPALCNQCNNAPCTRVCPTKATYKDKTTGIVRVESRLCTGCRACMTVCPYNARYFNNTTRTVDKCDFCWEKRLSAKEAAPACVEACPAGALVFGDLADKTSVVAGLVHNEAKQIAVLRPERGTQPNVFYLRAE